MTSEITKVIEELGNEIKRLAQTVLVEQEISKQSELYKNLKVEIETSGNAIVIDILFENHITFIENGRAPRTGRKPPIEALKSWAENKGLPTDNDTLYAISTAIWRDGIEGRPILSTLQERIEEYMDNDFADKLMDAIIKELNKYFD